MTRRDPLAQCPDVMLLPPQADGVELRCQLLPDHAGDMHAATDDDGVDRRWPRDAGPARTAAGAKPRSWSDTRV